MHELGLADSALRIALAEARKAGALRVQRIEMRVGTLSGADPDALRFALETLLPGTAAEGAAVQIDSVEALAYCGECRKDFAPDDEFFFVCPECLRPSTEIVRGRELEVSRVELCVSHAAELPS